MNNDILIQQLKNAVWEKYKTIKSGDFQEWYEGISPIERAAWRMRFDEVQDEPITNIDHTKVSKLSGKKFTNWYDSLTNEEKILLSGLWD